MIYGGLDLPLAHTEVDQVSGERVDVKEPGVVTRLGAQVVVGFWRARRL